MPRIAAAARCAGRRRNGCASGWVRRAGLDWGGGKGSMVVTDARLDLRATGGRAVFCKGAGQSRQKKQSAVSGFQVVRGGGCGVRPNGSFFPKGPLRGVLVAVGGRKWVRGVVCPRAVERSRTGSSAAQRSQPAAAQPQSAEVNGGMGRRKKLKGGGGGSGGGSLAAASVSLRTAIWGGGRWRRGSVLW